MRRMRLFCVVAALAGLWACAPAKAVVKEAPPLGPDWYQAPPAQAGAVCAAGAADVLVGYDHGAADAREAAHQKLVDKLTDGMWASAMPGAPEDADQRAQLRVLAEELARQYAGVRALHSERDPEPMPLTKQQMAEMDFPEGAEPPPLREWRERHYLLVCVDFPQEVATGLMLRRLASLR